MPAAAVFSPARRATWWQRATPFWIVITILTLLLRAPAFWVDVLDPDEAGHAVNAQVWLAGGTPYVDFADNKQPLLYAAYAAAFIIAGRSLISVHLLTIPWVLLTAWLVGRAAAGVWRTTAAARAATLMFTLGSVAYLEKDMLSTNTEVLMNLPLVAAVVLLVSSSGEDRWWRSAVAGACAGAALLFNLKAAFALPALLVTLLARQAPRRLPHTLAAAGSLAAVLVGAAAWFWSRDALTPFLYWNIVSNLGYMGTGVSLLHAGVANGLVYGYPRLLLFAIGTVPLWIGAATAWSVPTGDSPVPSLRNATAIWAAGSLVAVCLGGRFYGHYFIQLVPPLAILAAGPLSSRGASALAMSRAALVALAVSACVWTAAGYFRIASTRLDSQRPPIREVSERVRAMTRPADRIFVWGYWPELYYRAERLPASRFVFPQSLAGYVPGNPFTLLPGSDPTPFIVKAHWQQFAEDIERRPAELIVDTAPGAIHFWERYPVARYPVLRTLLAQRYSRAAVVHGVVIYRLRREGVE